MRVSDGQFIMNTIDSGNAQWQLVIEGDLLPNKSEQNNLHCLDGLKQCHSIRYDMTTCRMRPPQIL